MNRIRWSDNDCYWGPFTYAAGDYKRLAIVLGSGDGDDYPGCRLRLSIGRRTLIVALPPIIKPAREWVDTSRHSWSSDRGGFWDQHEREYGFSYSDGFLNVSLGRVTNDSSTEQRWGYFLPWTQRRHVRHSLYDLAGKRFADLPQGGRFLDNRAATKALEDACPVAVFRFADFDGEVIEASTRIGEREWHHGTGWFKWLAWFRKPVIQRSLEIEFSKETGKRKGSWKGGTLGHGISMMPGELHEAAFRRYCGEHQMTFLAIVDTRPQDEDVKQASLAGSGGAEGNRP